MDMNSKVVGGRGILEKPERERKNQTLYQRDKNQVTDIT